MKYSWIVKKGSHLQSETNNPAESHLNNMEPSSMQSTIKSMIRKPKRFRSAFTTEQISFLEQQFKKFPYISSEHRKEIATALNMQERAIKIWFQNRRMKEKKESINKEHNYETTNKLDGQERLINECTLTSANEPLSYSLPIIVKPVDTSTIFANTNTDSRRSRDQVETKTQQVPHNLSKNYIKSPMSTNSDRVPRSPCSKEDVMQRDLQNQQYKNNLPQIYKKSTEFSINFDKKLKNEINHLVNPQYKSKEQKHLVPGHPTTTAKIRPAPEDLSSRKKSRAPQMPSRPPKKPKLSNSTCYPVMPAVYAHPYISSGGMIWKPINVMPVMSARTTINVPNNHQHSFGHGQKKSCSCNCHENGQPFTVQSNPISPYAQYVIAAPLSNPRTKF